MFGEASFSWSDEVFRVGVSAFVCLFHCSFPQQHFPAQGGSLLGNSPDGWQTAGYSQLDIHHIPHLAKVEVNPSAGDSHVKKACTLPAARLMVILHERVSSVVSSPLQGCSDPPGCTGVVRKVTERTKMLAEEAIKIRKHLQEPLLHPLGTAPKFPLVAFLGFEP